MSESVSACGWNEGRPEFPHGEPEWRVTGRCPHGHPEGILLCGGCKETVEAWQRTRLAIPAPWCATCYRMRPGGHHCTVALKIRPLRLGQFSR